jgi:hypothetical protein
MKGVNEGFSLLKTSLFAIGVCHSAAVFTLSP